MVGFFLCGVKTNSMIITKFKDTKIYVYIYYMQNLEENTKLKVLENATFSQSII